MTGALNETSSVSALWPHVPGFIWRWGVCKTYQRLRVVHWSKVLWSHRLLSYASLMILRGACWNAVYLWERTYTKTWIITTMEWLRLSSKSELCDGCLTTETAHNLLLCYTGRKGNSDDTSQTVLLYTCKNVVSVYSNDRQFQKEVDII